MEGCFVAGADPELMLIGPKGDLVSAIGVVPGTKTKPHPVKLGAVQHDNVLSEFNIDPADSSEEMEHHMRTVLQELAHIVAPNRLQVLAYAEFPAAALEHKTAKIFGCDPDFSAWPNDDGILTMNSVDGSKAYEPYRSAGGHWHVGYKDITRDMLANDYGKIEVVKMMDVFMGIPSIILDQDSTSLERRTLYGKAGSHRPKEYGVEYRALGNFWVSSPALTSLMYELCELAVSLTLSEESQEIFERLGQSQVQDCINTSNAQSAYEMIIGPLGKYLSTDLKSRIFTNEDSSTPNLYQSWSIN